MKKIKYLLLIIGITFISINNVNASTKLTNPLDCFKIAESSSSKNLIINEANNLCGYVNKNFWQYEQSDTGKYLCMDYFIPIESNTTYTLTYFNSTLNPVQAPASGSIYIFDENFNQLFKQSTWVDPPYNFTTPSDSKYFNYCVYNSNKFLTYNIQLEKGTFLKEELTFVPYEKYVEKPIINPDSTLNDFYNIYTSKIQQISQYSRENKFILSAIGIVLSIVVLNLFLYLFNKGGKY